MNKNFLQQLRVWQSVTGTDRALFFRSLSAMFNSGVSLDRCLLMLAEQQANVVMAEVCSDMANKIAAGRYLSNALSQQRGVFSPTHVRLVAVGEKTGQLASCLSRLAQLEERQQEIQMQIRSSLTVPLIVCGFCLLMVMAAPPILFKPLLTMLSENGASMPWPTRILAFFSDALRSPLTYIGFVLGLLGLGWWVSRQWRDASRVLSWVRFLKSLPLLGPIWQLLSLTGFAQNLFILTSVGVPVLQSLEYAAQATADPALITDIKLVIEQVSQGQSIGLSMQESGGFPTIFCQAITAGEESGRLTDMLESMAEMYQVNLEHGLEVLTKSLEPILLGVVGGIVAFTVVATLLPMLKVMDTL